ncbi:hypothetical protein GCM10010277_08710 [Streptomyces longisporoflavus]|nr:hypothetical protein GCM10010277_08710 [Streptomyces longisporoflavus]
MPDLRARHVQWQLRRGRLRCVTPGLMLRAPGCRADAPSDAEMSVHPMDNSPPPRLTSPIDNDVSDVPVGFERQ